MYNVDVIFLQETWLSDCNSNRITDSFRDYMVTHTSAMESKISSGILVVRPFGGTAVLIHRKLARHCNVLFSSNPRITTVRCRLADSCDLVLGSVYMPYDNGSVDYTAELEDVVGCLQGIMDKYCNSKFIIGDDFNLCKPIDSCSSEVMDSLCSDNCLVWMDHDVSTGSYTFHNDVANRYSLIDHFVASAELVPPSHGVNILTDDDNLSDHYAILSNFSIICSLPERVSDCRSDCSKRLDWKKADISQYQSLLSELLSSIPLPVEALLCQVPSCENHASSLEYYYNRITECLLTASSQSVPAVKVGVEKHWWTPDLDNLKQECIDICHLWNQIGRPRSGFINAERLKRKYRYKLAVKEAALDADKAFNDNLFKHLCNKNQVEFWKSWRRRFCANKCRPASNINGCHDDINILREFTDYFKVVGQPNSVEADQRDDGEVEHLLSHSVAVSNDGPLLVNLFDLQEAISKLKVGKAVSFDGIYNEHVLYSSIPLHVHLCLLFNALLRHGFVPNDFLVGVVIPVLKSKHGDPTNLDMYRGITVAPAISKLFESVLLELYGSYLYSDPLQFGFKKNSSCNSALFTFTEAVKFCNNHGSNVYCAFLDASKAFDKVLHNGLFLKLIKRNVPFAFIRLLRYWYSHLSCIVRWNGVTGPAFPVLCGVRQGGILSPFLFAVYVDDLISNLRQSGYGVYIGKLFVGCVVYADDIALLSVSCFGLQKLMDVCEKYGILWDITFNPAKSQIACFGPKSTSICNILLNGHVVTIVDKVKYLGVYFESKLGRNDISQAFVRFYSQFNNIMAVLGKRSSEVTALYLVQTYCLPTLLFACETWNLSDQSVHKLNVAWNNCFRRIFQGFWRESVKPLQYFCGSLPLPYLLDQRRIVFWKHMLKSDNPVLCTLSHFVYNRTLASDWLLI